MLNWDSFINWVFPLILARQHRWNQHSKIKESAVVKNLQAWLGKMKWGFKKAQLISKLWLGERTWTMTFSKRSPTCGFSFDCSATSVSLRCDKARLPACPVAGEARHWPLDQRVSSHIQVTGWPPTSQPTAEPQNFLLRTRGGSKSKSSRCFRWWVCLHWSRTLQRD